VILALKVAVTAVTLLLFCSLVAVIRGNYRLHGRINIVFFALTLAAVLGLELISRVISPEMFSQYLRETQSEKQFFVHLCFSLPAATLLPFMLFTGLKRRRSIHLMLAAGFGICWTGTFITGVFFLPHY